MKNDFPGLNIRQASDADLEAINAVIRKAVSGWNLPERVKRLSLPGFLYNVHDLAQMTVLIATRTDQSVQSKQYVQIVGVAALDLEASDSKSDKSALLHGLFVAPEFQRQGIGKSLLGETEKRLQQKNIVLLHVKAHKEAVRFFLGNGFSKRPKSAGRKEYEHWLMKRLDQTKQTRSASDFL